MATERKRRGRPTKKATEIVMEQVEVQDEGSSGDASSIPMEEGTEPGDLFASEVEKTLEVFHLGKKWIFKYKDLDWGAKNKCLDEAQNWQDGEFKFSIQKYYASALTKMLTQTPVRPITEMTLQKLDRFVGEQLTAIVPQPIEAPPDLEALKKA